MRQTASCGLLQRHLHSIVRVLTSTRLLLAVIALFAEAVHLGWEALHGGIVSHHPLQNSALPGLSNAWGLLVLPGLAAWAADRLPQRHDGARQWRPVALGFALPLLLGAALSLAFSAQMQTPTEFIFFSLLLMALLLPAHRPESLLGFVLGMSWTFGAVLPVLIGGLIAGMSCGARGAARWAWRAMRLA